MARAHLRMHPAAVDTSGRVTPAGLEQCPQARSAAAWDRHTHTEPEAIPGPSFISVSLMDVMEGLRLTQLKVDKVSDELGEVKNLLHVLLCQQPQTPAISVESDPPVSDRRDDHIRQDNPKRNENVRSQRPSDTGLLVVGDSNVRRLKLCNTRANISFRSIPGAATEHVEREVQASTETVAPNVVLHVGTNDLTRNGSEQIVSNLVKLAQQTKKRSGVRQVYICSVTPRKDIGSFVYSRAESVNNRLHSLCPKLAGIEFLDLRQCLDRCPFTGLVRDGVHYNKAGATQVLNTIMDSVGSFLA